MISCMRFALTAPRPSRFFVLARELRHQFPGLVVQPPGNDGCPVVEVDLEAWRSDDFDLPGLDDRVAETLAGAGRCELCLRGAGTEGEVMRAARQVVTRFQRFISTRNRASATARFERVLAIHAGLHDRSLPLVAADHDHALDCWQWVLRLAPAASFALQLAALFHDVERLETESRLRVEQHALDYQAWKDVHAAAGAARAAHLLGDAGIDARTVARVRALIAGHEQAGPGRGDARTVARVRALIAGHEQAGPGRGAARTVGCVRALVAGHEQAGPGPEARALAEADALSFFSLNSPGFLAYFGPAHTARKVAHGLARLGPRGRRALDGLKLCGGVHALLDAVLEMERGAVPERAAL